MESYSQTCQHLRERWYLNPIDMFQSTGLRERDEGREDGKWFIARQGTGSWAILQTNVFSWCNGIRELLIYEENFDLNIDIYSKY